MTKTENLDFLAAVRLLKDKGGYIKLPEWLDEYIVFYGVIEHEKLVCMFRDVVVRDVADFWNLLTAQNILRTDWDFPFAGGVY